GISNFCISWSIGYTIGPFFAGFFSDFFIRTAFVLASLFYLIGLIIIIFFIPKLKGPHVYNEGTKEIESENSTQFNQANSILKYKCKDYQIIERDANNPILLRIILGMLIYAMLGKIALTYFSDYASRTEGLNLSGTLIGIILFSFGLGRTVYFILSRFIRSSLKRINFSYLIITILLISMVFLDSVVFIFLVFVVFGFSSGLIYKSSLELLMYYEKEAKGAKAGLFESAVGMGSAFSPLIAGLLAEVFLTFPFIIFSLIAFTVFVINLVYEMKIKKLKS
ncbi:MAG: MFS transporter, partial [Candidatus Lokiarchaeota archaeon]|nr:MFS transporter [Candidatus Lokiarchaeota archaeon]MBD3339409.1 MFS transporter [Candidatus Lokiarchaeota archaeon]